MGVAVMSKREEVGETTSNGKAKIFLKFTLVATITQSCEACLENQLIWCFRWVNHMAYEWHFSKTAIEKYYDVILEPNIDDYYCYRWFFRLPKGWILVWHWLLFYLLKWLQVPDWPRTYSIVQVSVELSVLALLPECWSFRASLISSHLKGLIEDVMRGFDAHSYYLNTHL